MSTYYVLKQGLGTTAYVHSSCTHGCVVYCVVVVCTVRMLHFGSKSAFTHTCNVRSTVYY